ncbi:hypothetical protein GIB67_001668 [Kingdonia uniflora]|uniref:O-fucosyltransferase family protein n=1 Tax=Kingdonia uniflora TaxID=39325 RepID=A0A7J7L9M7_9MAGN|nr:hypothetical protein GIB67_001668 [Kingdonia uniflora]
MNFKVGLLLRAMGYPPKTIIYLAGSETCGGQRVLIPLRAMYTNSVDRTSLCSKEELSNLINLETPLPQDTVSSSRDKSDGQLHEEWKKAGPRPRPLPPPPDRPIYRHEKEGWYGWIAEMDTEPDPSPIDMRNRAHRLMWDALDYIVSVEADVFFPGFHNDGGGWPDFSSLVMGHRLYEMAYARTYRPDRKLLAELFNSTCDHMYYPGRNGRFQVAWSSILRAKTSLKDEVNANENELSEDEMDLDSESDDKGTKMYANTSVDQDDEMDPMIGEYTFTET